jgi:hypothetical protein
MMAYFRLLTSDFFDAITENGQVVVHDLKRGYTEVANLEGFMGKNLVELDGRNTWIAMLSKAVRQHFKHSLTGNGVGIDVDFAKLAIGSDIIQTAHMVVMSMSNQDAVNTSERMRHDLLSEIGTTVDE